jgi:hypothetical protein
MDEFEVRRIQTALQHIRETGNLDSFSATRAERVALVATASKKGWVIWVKARGKFELTKAGEKYLERASVREARLSSSGRAFPLRAIAATAVLIAVGGGVAAKIPTGAVLHKIMAPMVGEVATPASDVAAVQMKTQGAETASMDADQQQASVASKTGDGIKPAAKLSSNTATVSASSANKNEKSATNIDTTVTTSSIEPEQTTETKKTASKSVERVNKKAAKVDSIESYDHTGRVTQSPRNRDPRSALAYTDRERSSFGQPQRGVGWLFGSNR